uniref:Homeobox domain-containing protein n=1 Tax=Pseudonaja textilis TaxID=8673 RepID=A0A670ZNG3_PSETE
MAQLMQWLLRQEHWLPPGITWEDMQNTEDILYPQPHHLLLCLPIALLLIMLRVLFYRKIAIPLSKKLGLQEKVRRKPSPNPILEAFYTNFSHLVLSPDIQEEVSGLAKQCDLQPRQVERWFRYRLNQNQPSLTKKFCEARSWQILYVYYLMQFSLYWSLAISMPFDVKQKSSWLLLHCCVVLLMRVYDLPFQFCVTVSQPVLQSLATFLHPVAARYFFAGKVKGEREGREGKRRKEGRKDFQYSSQDSQR